MSKHRKTHKRKRSSSPATENEPEDLYTARHDLQSYIEDNYHIRSTEDFWRFYLKFEAAQKHRNQFDCTAKFFISFARNAEVLYEKLPLYKRNGKRLNIDKQQFKVLDACCRAYTSFQQTKRFEKLKGLRRAQAELPITAFKAEILNSLSGTDVVLIAGDTGCGKSTQVPQYLHEAGYRRVACTQPRRIACVSLAQRVAHECLATYKRRVGFQIRFERRKNKQTAVLFLTEGILLRQAADETINGYDCIVLDEVHERHLNMDFLVGIMKCLLMQKHKFKLILMSATINLQLFADYFRAFNVKTVVVPGRLFPIEILYRPIKKDQFAKKSSSFDSQPFLDVVKLIDAKLQPHERGDVLIFLNGLYEIQRLVANIEEATAESATKWIVLALHSSLSIEDQERVFHLTPEGARKCIVSTNVAETSVTIDNIRFVIDSGKVNRMTYESTCVNKLTTVDISQDSAKQRCGRAGRTGPGTCYRLYSEEQFAAFEAFTPAEIHLVPLENLVLQMVTLGLKQLEQFPFLEKPLEQQLLSAVERLKVLGALKTDGSGALCLSKLGDAMGRLPVDLSIGRMLITSTALCSGVNSATLAALISVQNILDENRVFDLRKEHLSDHGEPLTLLNLFKCWLELKIGGRNSRQWCRKCGVEEQRFYEATKLVHQFRNILQDADLLPKSNEALSSREKQIRHGELKHLKRLRRDLQAQANSSNRKVLKANVVTHDDATAADQDQNEPMDIRDVEFRIVNDLQQMSELLANSKTDSRTDLVLFKVLLTSALYPQIAVEDEFNGSKTVSERLWHTKVKPYVFLRPSSFFSMHPDYFELSDADVEVPPSGYFSKKPLSSKHQVLVYQKLLETRKTYLMNVFRMPALETLLLFAHKICTNRTITKFVFDDFLLVECPFLWTGKEMLLRSLQLRKDINACIERNLDREDAVDERTKFELIQRTVEFIAGANVVAYNIKRLLPADLKSIYLAEEEVEETAWVTQENDPSCNPFDPQFQIRGAQVADNLFYGNLPCDNYDLQAEMALMELERCPLCSKELRVTTLVQLMVHERLHCPRASSSLQAMKEKLEAAEGGSSSATNRNMKRFTCPKCNEELLLTQVEFLRHRKYCTTEIVETVEN